VAKCDDPCFVYSIHFSQEVVKKSFPNVEQNAKGLNKYGGNSGEKPVDNVKMNSEAAQILALEALTWVMGQDELIDNFLSTTGAYPKDLPQLASQPLFWGAVLDFLMEDDQRIIGFCSAHNHPLTIVQMARAALPGAQYMHWT
jgi:Protein of unknown function (DUF3572)